MTIEIKELAQQAFREFVTELVTGSLARGNQPSVPVSEAENSLKDTEDSAAESIESSRSVETTDEELQAYEIVKDIVKDVVDTERVIIRDNPTYCPVFLDSNRRPLCRFFFDRQQKQIGLFDGSRYEGGALIATMYNIDSVNHIYDHAEQLRETAQRYLEA